MTTTFRFDGLTEPARWTGRYNRIPGKEPVFKAKIDGSAHAYWAPWNSGEVLTSRFVDQPGVRDMVTAINRTKERYANQAGGSFQINEFGQVLCPLTGSAARYWVGNASGVPVFEDPRNPGATFELCLPASTQPDTPWERPYIGMKFNLDGNDSIYFQEDDGDTRRKLRLSKSDPDLIRRLRLVRGNGQTIRFIVNLHGIVLTKRHPHWQPVFVGFINLNLWFPKQP